MEITARRRPITVTPFRPILAVASAAIALVGCASGSEEVLVPGAGAAASAPAVSVERTPVTDPGPTNDSTSDATDAPPPTIEPDPATSASTDASPPETTAAPPATDAAQDDVFLRLGDESPEVELMQFKLSVLEYLPTGSDTGVFDEATQSGLRRFQSDYGLGVDGIFGPLTGRALNAAIQSVAVET